MPAGSKIRSTRSISWTWYCIVSRSSKTQVMFGPTATLRDALVRKDSRAKCVALARVVLEGHELRRLQALPRGRHAVSP